MHHSPFLDLRVNTSEITQRLQHEKANVRDPAAWAPHLNAAIGDGLRTAAWKHMVREPRFTEAIGPGGFLAVTSLINTELFSDPNYYPYAVMTFNALRGTSSLVARVPLREICWSLTPIVHPDRAIAVSALTRMRKLVKAL
jgi:hypothetical protein